MSEDQTAKDQVAKDQSDKVVAYDGRLRSRKGRASLVSDESVVAKIEAAVLAGNSLSNAAALAGVKYRTVLLWLRKGRDAKRDCAAKRFYERVRMAEAEAIHRSLMIIQKAARTRWQAAAWFLERKRPEEWGMRQYVENSGPGGGPMHLLIEPKLHDALRRAYGDEAAGLIGATMQDDAALQGVGARVNEETSGRKNVDELIECEEPNGAAGKNGSNGSNGSSKAPWCAGPYSHTGQGGNEVPKGFQGVPGPNIKGQSQGPDGGNGCNGGNGAHGP